MSPRTDSMPDDRRVQKYLERANEALNSPMLDLWPLDSGGKTVTMFIPADGSPPGPLEEPTIDVDIADATIGRLRPFIMSREDIHIPKVIESAKRLIAQGSAPEAADSAQNAIAALDYIAEHLMATSTVRATSERPTGTRGRALRRVLFRCCRTTNWLPTTSMGDYCTAMNGDSGSWSVTAGRKKRSKGCCGTFTN